MTYLTFHLVFILPPLALMLFAIRGAVARLGSRARWTLPLMAVIALLYTTPWDNYLVYRGIWWYGTDRVLGTIGYVPVEEYLFFLLQPLLVGAWTYWLLMRTDLSERRVPPLRRVPRVLLPGLLLYGGAALAGALALGSTSGTYMGLILVWAGPVLAAQWFLAAPFAAAAPRVFVLAVAVPTLYLWLADRIAIGAGIWSISPAHTTGYHLLGLPAEEAVFFLATNLLVVQGVLLFLQPGLVAVPRRHAPSVPAA